MTSSSLSVLAPALTSVAHALTAAPVSDAPTAPVPTAPADPAPSDTLDLSPAKWLWYPGGRTLPNTFVLFRRVLPLVAKPRKATGWIIGESRHQLDVNGHRVQWGPARTTRAGRRWIRWT